MKSSGFERTCNIISLTKLQKSLFKPTSGSLHKGNSLRFITATGPVTMYCKNAPLKFISFGKFVWHDYWQASKLHFHQGKTFQTQSESTVQERNLNNQMIYTCKPTTEEWGLSTAQENGTEWWTGIFNTNERGTILPEKISLLCWPPAFPVPPLPFSSAPSPWTWSFAPALAPIH